MSTSRPVNPRRIGIVLYQGMDLLDLAIAEEVFYLADLVLACGPGPIDLHVAADPSRHGRFYQRISIGMGPGPYRTGSGLRIAHDRGGLPGRLDLLIVPGGDPHGLSGDPGQIRRLRRLVERADHTASICSGAHILAACGVLDGRRATTHWLSGRMLADRHPRVSVVHEAVFVIDGPISTSAGSTAGIDLLLAMVEAHHGSEIAYWVAHHMVVHRRRAGGDAQSSLHLRQSSLGDASLAAALDWALAHPDDDLSLSALARIASMSERTLTRRWRAALGTTPARTVERLRIEAARRRMDDAGMRLEEVARSSGFRSADVMRRTFIRHFGLTPKTYRQRFTAGSRPA